MSFILNILKAMLGSLLTTGWEWLGQLSYGMTKAGTEAVLEHLAKPKEVHVYGTNEKQVARLQSGLDRARRTAAERVRLSRPGSSDSAGNADASGE